MELNEAQRRLVSFVPEKGKHACVLACPGTGKTTTVAHWLKEEKRRAGMLSHVLALSFSKKAAMEIREKVGLDDVDIHTFHGFCLKHIIYPAFKVLFPCLSSREELRILDKQDELDVLKRFISEDETLLKTLPDVDDDRLLKIFTIIQQLSETVANEGYWFGETGIDRKTFAFYFEQHMHELPDYLQNILDNPEGLDAIFKILNNFYLFKIEQGYITYGELISRSLLVLKHEVYFKKHLQKKYKVVIIDESQDTNRAQFILVSLIGGKNSIIVVGDEDQMIYAWRGARHENINIFIQHYKPEIICLEHSYRLNGQIAEKANKLIKNNFMRNEKQIIPASDNHHAVSEFLVYKTDKKMAEDLVDRIELLIKQGVEPSSIAVLYRVNKIGDFLYPFFVKRKIPFRFLNGKDIMNSKVIKTLIDIKVLLFKDDDILAFSRIAGLIDGIGEKIIKDIVSLKLKTEGATWQDVIEAFPEKRVRWLKAYMDKVYQYRKQLKEKRVETISSDVLFKEMEQMLFNLLENLFYNTKALKRFGIVQGFEATRTDEKAKRDKLYLLVELFMVMLENAFSQTEKKGNGISFLSSIYHELMVDIEHLSVHREDKSAVVLSTVHSAKGMEWDYVFIPGASQIFFGKEQSALPMEKNWKESENKNLFIKKIIKAHEERNLFYVALTRARKGVFPMHAESNKRILKGSIKEDVKTEVSQFVFESGF